jgi:hypothetical protein
MSRRNHDIQRSTARTTRHDGYAQSIRHHKWIEEAFGWAKTVGHMAQTVYRGIERVRSRFILTMAANTPPDCPGCLLRDDENPRQTRIPSAQKRRARNPEKRGDRKPSRIADFFSGLLTHPFTAIVPRSAAGKNYQPKWPVR